MRRLKHRDVLLEEGILFQVESQHTLQQVRNIIQVRTHSEFRISGNERSVENGRFFQDTMRKTFEFPLPSPSLHEQDQAFAGAEDEESEATDVSR